ncbi:glycoside hydrolase family 3 N-terminal domain-containing protein [Natrialbaceae archaeon A-chndr2]
MSFENFEATTDASQTIETLLERMTVREKAAQLAGTYVGELDEQRTPEEARKLVSEYGLGFATPFGYGAAAYTDPVESARFANELQRIAIEETRLGIPIAIPVDAVHGHAYVAGGTVFPHNLGMAATRDRQLVERVGTVTAREVAATGAAITYGPTCDVARDPRWGRTFETFGASPRLCGELAAAKAHGVHDADPDVGVVAKHFPAYGEPEQGEDTAPVDRSMSSIYRDFLPPFEAAIDAGVDGIMPCYNSINSVPSHGSEFVLRKVLREELGFEGYVASDWNGIGMLHENHGTAESMEDAVGQSLVAGVDVHSLGEEKHVEYLEALVEDGTVDESLLDDAVRRVLSLKADLELFEKPYVDVSETRTVVGADDHQKLSLEASRSSITLVQNDGVLPFEHDIGEVLVTGPNGDRLDHQVGGWSCKNTEDLSGITVREGVESVVAADTKVTFEPGAGISEPGDVDAAVDAAADADAAIVVVGENWYLHEFGPEDVAGPPESFPNRTQLGLPAPQRDLVEAVAATDTPTAVVVISGRPTPLPRIAETVPAIAYAYYPGAQGGLAVAETLFGLVNPSGALPISVPRSTGHLPTRHNHLSHPYPIGRKEHGETYDPLWPFGHGLSYTEFEYCNLSATPERLAADETVSVEVTLANRGTRAGAKPIDIFASRPYSSVVTPVRELVGFDRVHVDPDEERTVRLQLSADRFAVVGPDGDSRVEPGTVELSCGEHSTSVQILD